MALREIKIHAKMGQPAWTEADSFKLRMTYGKEI
jgi:hypothetical protein